MRDTLELSGRAPRDVSGRIVQAGALAHEAGRLLGGVRALRSGRRDHVVNRSAWQA